MRRARVKAEGEAFYHVMSRCALQQHLLTDDVKGMFMKILRRAEYFSGVKIVNYCIMDKSVSLRSGKTISGADTYPVFIGKNIQI